MDLDLRKVKDFIEVLEKENVTDKDLKVMMTGWAGEDGYSYVTVPVIDVVEYEDTEHSKATYINFIWDNYMREKNIDKAITTRQLYDFLKDKNPEYPVEVYETHDWNMDTNFLFENAYVAIDNRTGEEYFEFESGY